MTTTTKQQATAAASTTTTPIIGGLGVACFRIGGADDYNDSEPPVGVRNRCHRHTMSLDDTIPTTSNNNNNDEEEEDNNAGVPAKHSDTNQSGGGGGVTPGTAGDSATYPGGADGDGGGGGISRRHRDPDYNEDRGSEEGGGGGDEGSGECRRRTRRGFRSFSPSSSSPSPPSSESSSTGTTPTTTTTNNSSNSNNGGGGSGGLVPVNTTTTTTTNTAGERAAEKIDAVTIGTTACNSSARCNDAEPASEKQPQTRDCSRGERNRDEQDNVNMYRPANQWDNEHHCVHGISSEYISDDEQEELDDEYELGMIGTGDWNGSRSPLDDQDADEPGSEGNRKPRSNSGTDGADSGKDDEDILSYCSRKLGIPQEDLQCVPFASSGQLVCFAHKDSTSKKQPNLPTAHSPSTSPPSEHCSHIRTCTHCNRTLSRLQSQNSQLQWKLNSAVDALVTLTTQYEEARVQLKNEQQRSHLLLERLEKLMSSSARGSEQVLQRRSYEMLPRRNMSPSPSPPGASSPRHMPHLSAPTPTSISKKMHSPKPPPLSLGALTFPFPHSAATNAAIFPPVLLPRSASPDRTNDPGTFCRDPHCSCPQFTAREDTAWLCSCGHPSVRHYLLSPRGTPTSSPSPSPTSGTSPSPSLSLTLLPIPPSTASSSSVSSSSFSSAPTVLLPSKQ
ncbi:hypothetical protein Pelo_15392 [Pelomyxa schiedti]|nr:hypothetical protein Pelo_15392 [Pelomyxa schiedti]